MDKKETTKQKIQKLIQFLKEYEFKHVFNEDELNTYFLVDSEMKWTKKPIVFSSVSEGKKYMENKLNIFAFGGVIGQINLEDENASFYLNSSKIKAYVKFLYKVMETGSPLTNEREEIIYVPKCILEGYEKENKETIEERKKAITIMMENRITDIRKLPINVYLDIMICAAYIRFMHRKKETILDVSERSMQCMLARKNQDIYNEKQNMLVVDIEYVGEAKTDEIDAAIGVRKNAFVDFVFLDKESKSFGLVEFKYQGKSMPEDMKPYRDKEGKLHRNNSLASHFRDFKNLILEQDYYCTVDALIKHTRNLIKYGIIKDASLEDTLDIIENKHKNGDRVLWCGFYFLDNTQKPSENIDGITLGEEVEKKCRKQLLEKYRSDIEENSLEVRYQHSDINDWVLKMQDELIEVL